MLENTHTGTFIDYVKGFISLMLFVAITNMTWSQNFPNNFAGVQIATGLDAIGMDHAPDGRIFIAQKDGRIQIIKNDVLLSTSFTRLSNVDVDGERGLQKVLIDPSFNTNKYLYVYYTRKSGTSSFNRVSRLTANGDAMVSGSELVLIDMPNLGSSKFHNGGGLAIKDGKLYISVGENTISNFAQSLETVKGKILRINTDGSIPTDNPFYNSTSGQNRAIWALGFRNPFRLSVQGGTGRIYANDVGASSYEEINEVLKGKNYGWPTIEGKRTNQTAPANYVDPVYAYSHNSGCAITAGTFYSPTTAQFPSQYVGKYFFGDYCNDYIKTFDPETKTVSNFATNVNRPLDVLITNDGRMYFLSRGDGDNTSSSGGVLWRVNYTGNGLPVIAVQPKSQTVSVAQSVTFAVQASGTPTPTFQWQRNGTNISNATSASYTLANPSLSDSGAKFKVKVNNSQGTVTSSEATLTVINNDKPVATITSPASGTKYRAGDVISFSGTGMDTEDGSLPASAFTWRIDLYHFDDPAHNHPARDPVSGSKSGTFTVPVEMETSPNVLFRIFLTVVDSKGATHTVSRDITPITTDITLATNPAGLNLKIDGRVVTAPYTFKGASGVLRSIEAVSSQTVGGKTYVFSSWSDGGAKEHTISTPGTNTTITANFVEGVGIVNGAIYEMQPQHDTNLRLDVRGSSTANSSLVDGIARNGSSSQKWKFISVGNDRYEIEPQHAIGKRLDLGESSTANNAEIHIYQRNGNNNQLWKAIDLGQGIYSFEPVAAPGKLLDIENVNNIPRALSRTVDNGDSQHWKLLTGALNCSIVPYINVDNGGWNSGSTATVDVGGEVWFGPQSQEFGATGGTWSYTGPNNQTHSGRSWVISNIQANQAGVYTVTDADQNGCVATHTFTVNITGIDTPPAVSFASPSSGTQFNPGSSVAVTVNASSASGSIAQVELFLNNNLVRRESYAPYEWNAPGQNDPSLVNMAAGNYTLKAVATDNNGTTSEATRAFTVGGSTPVQITIEAVQAEQTGNGATNLLDGNTDDASRWSADGFSKWVIFDLGVSTSITGTKMWTFQNRAYQYTVEVSNSPTTGFSTVSNQSGNTNAAQPLTTTFSATGRYVRLTVTGASGYTGAWVSINEFQILTGSTAKVVKGKQTLKDYKNLDPQMQIYPNPADESFNVEISGVDKVDISIFNLDGRLLFTRKGVSGILNVKRSNVFKSGLYILNATTESGEVFTEKIVIK